jgi:C-terminal processing protease CtpA/Prc
VAEDIPPPVIEPARALTPRGLENLKAFARAYGYVRFFHPSVEARSIDWERFAVEGVRAVEGAAGGADLAGRLGKLFPATVRFSASGEPKVEALPSGELVRWIHHGFGGGQPGIYRSESAAVSGPPPEPLRADLGGGVRIALSTAMPRGEAKPPGAQLYFSADDRATRLADVIIAWNVFEHFYPYFDVAGTDWPAELGKALEGAATDTDEVAFAHTLNRLVAALKDGHGNVSGPSAGRMSLPLALAWADGRVVLRDTGDAVLSIDGRPAAALLEEASREVSGATPGWIRHKALALLGAGAPGTTATIEVEPYGKPGTRETRQVTRGAVPPQPKRPEKVTELQPGVWYLDLTRISDADYAAALPKLASAKGLVFDLRGYPRVSPQWLQHLSKTPLESAQWHVPDVTRPDHVDVPFTRLPGWNLMPLEPYLAARRAVLTDGSAISYAESVMGIVEHYKLAEIVGENTAGTNGNVNPFRLPGGYTIYWTGMKVLKHDGTRHHGVGIAPGIPVPLTRAALAAGRDEVLERAVAVVAGEGAR